MRRNCKDEVHFQLGSSETSSSREKSQAGNSERPNSDAEITCLILLDRQPICGAEQGLKVRNTD